MYKDSIAGWRYALAIALFAVFCGVVKPIAQAAPVVDLTAYTEDWPPYNFEQDGHIKGIATDLLRVACTKAGLQCAIEMVPWARAYHTAGETPNTIVYSTARKPSRESEFLWVGPILPRVTWIYGRPGSENSFHALKDLAAARVGIVRGEASQQDLEKIGVPASAFVLESDNAKVLRQLTRNVVDVMVDTEAGMAWNLRDAGLPGSTVTRLMKLSDEGGYYFAVNLQTDPERVSRLQQAVDTLRREGKIDAISKDYGVRKQ